jgi:hypothetical protein
VAAQLASLHQLRHCVELADLRRAVLSYGVTEMGLLLREEAQRCDAAGGPQAHPNCRSKGAATLALFSRALSAAPCGSVRVCDGWALFVSTAQAHVRRGGRCAVRVTSCDL